MQKEWPTKQILMPMIGEMMNPKCHPQQLQGFYYPIIPMDMLQVGSGIILMMEGGLGLETHLSVQPKITALDFILSTLLIGIKLQLRHLTT